MSSFLNLPPRDAFDAIRRTPKAVLIDCRTRAEWVYVGVPVLPEPANQTAFIEWVDTAGSPNSDFLSQVQQVADEQTPIYMLCRSGVRSAAACQFLAESGYHKLVNVAEGFEGDLGPNGQRTSVNGWKFHGLPWIQQ